MDQYQSKKKILKSSEAAAAAAKSLQSCPTLCNPIDGSPPGSPVPGILQARTLEWVAISFSNAWKWKVKVKSLSHARLLAIPWTAAYQAPLFMGFFRQEYWSGLPLPSPVCVTTRIEYSLFPSLFTGAQISLEYKVMDVLASTVLKSEWSPLVQRGKCMTGIKYCPSLLVDFRI